MECTTLPEEEDGQTTINLNTGVQSGSGAASQEQRETAESSGADAGIQRQRLEPLQSEQQAAQEEEIRRLKHELEVTKQERDILKKTVGIFSQSQL